MSPRVSVLIPTYNYGSFLPAALESVLAQTYTDYEILVLDDGSSDHTAQVAAAYSQVRYLYQEHAGISAARNRLLREAQGEFAAFLDADDLWSAEKLEKQVSYLDAHPDCQLVFTRVKNFFDGAPEKMTLRQKQLMTAKIDFCLPSCCLRRAVFLQYGLFREDLPYGEDTYWAAHLGAAGVRLDHCIPEELYLRRIHTGNISLKHTPGAQNKKLALLSQAIRQARKKG